MSDFESETIGAGVSFGFPVTDNTGLQLRYRLQSDEINVEDTPIVIIEDTGALATEDVLVDQNNPQTPDDPSDDTAIPVAVSPDTVPLPDGAIIVDQCSPLFLFRHDDL